jgi:hypothetical protein
MKRLFGLLVALASLPCFVGFAHAIDPVKFMGMKAGKWNQYAVSDFCGNPMADLGLKVASTPEGNFLRKRYEKQGGSWAHDGNEIFKVEATKLSVLGFTDNNETWLFTPPIAISRTKPLNTPFVYKGTVVNQTTAESIPVIWVVAIVESGVTVTTTAKTFTNCIKILVNQIEGDDIEENIEFWCEGRGEVKSYTVRAKKTTDPEQPVSGKIFSKDLKAFGDSRAPF